MIAASQRAESTQQISRRVIIVGVDDPAEAQAAAHWAVREAALRKDDLLLVHAYDVPLLPTGGRAAAIERGLQERQALLDKGRKQLDSAADNAPRPAHRDRHSRVPATPAVRAGRADGARS